MRPIVTLAGIDEAISNLNYSNEKALKYRLIHAIREFYPNDELVESITEINSDELIKLLWDTGDDPVVIRNRRKNLSSIRSSINTDLNRLYKDGNNSEGINIGPANVFEMSDEAKDEILQSFTYSARGENPIPMGQIMEVLKVVNDLLTDPDGIADGDDSDGLKRLDQLKELVLGLSDQVGLASTESSQTGPETVMKIGGGGEATGGAPETEEVEVDEPEDEDIEEIEPEDELEEIDEDEDLEEIEDEEPEDEDIEEIEPEDELEEIDDEELEEVLDEEPEDEGQEKEKSLEDLLAEYSEKGYEGEDGIKKARLLADDFNSALATMDRYYNQYIMIPEGKYIVGSKYPQNGEKPKQKIHLPLFYFGKFPVTNALFEVFVEQTGYKTTAEKVGYGTVYFGRYQKVVDEETGLETFNYNSSLSSKIVKGACWYQPLGPGSMLHNKRSHPVVQISRDDAMAFAAWTGKRLPTEDEWEAASRTAKGYRFPWGKRFDKRLCNNEEAYIGDTTPVDKYKEYANKYGIVDTIGNVLEWTLDRVESSIDTYLVKGGSWISGNDVCLFSRFQSGSNATSNMLGFRCVAY
ncbi:MAG: SUMF1/EgtB/PvdO family nonheme iron enzyme [Deltaproteobacteria bacterium]|nr:SUMF1/EgtB/PvdO family nonheme iron enzyme [Deltaproteobacteria bacterium]